MEPRKQAAEGGEPHSPLWKEREAPGRNPGSKPPKAASRTAPYGRSAQMYLHLGQSVVVPEADILGIFDMDNTTSSRITRDFLSQAEKTKSITNVSEELPKSFVVCAKNDKTEVYLSQLSTQTLHKRSGTMKFDA